MTKSLLDFRHVVVIEDQPQPGGPWVIRAHRSWNGGGKERPRWSVVVLARRPGNELRSRFSVDAPSASYAQIRASVLRRRWPHCDVSVDELVNDFPYRYAPPRGGEPIALHLEVATCPWAPSRLLVRVGLKARVVERARAPEVPASVATHVAISLDSGRAASYRRVGSQDPVYTRVSALGSGHMATVLYEVTLDPRVREESFGVTVFYVPAGGDERLRLEARVPARATPFEEASEDFRFQCAVAAFGLIVQRRPVAATLDDVLSWSARTGSGAHRSDFRELVRRAQLFEPQRGNR